MPYIPSSPQPLIEVHDRRKKSFSKIQIQLLRGIVERFSVKYHQRLPIQEVWISLEESKSGAGHVLETHVVAKIQLTSGKKFVASAQRIEPKIALQSALKEISIQLDRTHDQQSKHRKEKFDKAFKGS